jgi:D-alanyl-lipoteichoic acid acyltransferase DltB (MBOAT superfamily)
MGYALARESVVGSTRRKRLLLFGVAADLALLGYYKYANFLVDSLNYSFGTHYGLAEIMLPLGRN